MKAFLLRLRKNVAINIVSVANLLNGRTDFDRAFLDFYFYLKKKILHKIKTSENKTNIRFKSNKTRGAQLYV